MSDGLVLKKSVSFYEEDYEYLKTLHGESISDKIRNLIKKEKKNNELAKIIFENPDSNQDIIFSMGSFHASCSFKSMLEVSQFYKNLRPIMNEESRIELIKTLIVMYSEA